MKKIVLLVITSILLIVSVILIVMGFNLDYTVKEKDEPVTGADVSKFNIIGKWYTVYDMSNFEYEFKEDGTYVVTDLDGYRDDSLGNYTLNKTDGSLILSEKQQYKDRVEYDDYDYVVEEADSDVFKVCYDEDDCIYFYKNKDERRPYDSKCLEPDKDGYCINDGVLVSYIGNDEEITIPSSVHIIGSNAFAGDFNRGINTNKVTIPGTVKEIEDSAFAYTRVNVVVFEEGVEYIGGNLFMDTCIQEVYFPKSLTSGAYSMFNPEERCGSIDIHLYKNSYIDNILKDDEPYYDEVNLIYR